MSCLALMAPGRNGSNKGGGKRSLAKYGVCRHCKKFLYMGKRGLCWHHYYECPDIRKRYDRVGPKGRRPGERQEFVRAAPLPPRPIDALPGSEAKIREMQRRAEKRQQLFHPGDKGARPRGWQEPQA